MEHSAHENSLPVLNIAAYKFVPLSEARVTELREDLTARCRATGVRGTIILSGEGINISLSGLPEEVETLFSMLSQIAEFSGIGRKDSWSRAVTFSRMLVKRKREVIPFGVDVGLPREDDQTHLDAETLCEWLADGRDVVLLDTRNDYEVEVGTFEGAKTLGLSCFRDFPEAVRSLEVDAHKPIVAFCTGGIRCEKAVPMMKQLGFREVYQLDGGILRYFEKCGSAHFEGECFVFDKRVAVDGALRETDTTVCYACQHPLGRLEQQSPNYIVGKQCPYCAAQKSTDTDSRIAGTVKQA